MLIEPTGRAAASWPDEAGSGVIRCLFSTEMTLSLILPFQLIRLGTNWLVRASV